MLRATEGRIRLPLGGRLHGTRVAPPRRTPLIWAPWVGTSGPVHLPRLGECECNTPPCPNRLLCGGKYILFLLTANFFADDENITEGKDEGI